MKIARVFPRKTEASPNDELAFFDRPGFFETDIDEAHISITFTYDIEKAKRLADQWSKITTVKIGGPALDDIGGEFIPGKYLKPGYVITSRGCPNNCWFCDVKKREGDIRELEIKNGWNILDSNLLACSDTHIKNVFSMLKKQKIKAQFTGGFEAKRLKEWHVSELWNLRPEQMFFAYDTEDDFEPLIEAGKMLRYANFTRQHLRCYCLIGYKNDTFEKAEKRLMQAWIAGFLPMAMLWKNKKGDIEPKWTDFQRIWDRPAITKTIVKNIHKKYFKGI